MLIDCLMKSDESSLSGLIRNLYKRLVFSQNNMDKIISEIKSLESLFLETEFSQEEEFILSSFMTNNNMLSVFQKFYECYEVYLEEQFVRDVFKDKTISEISYQLYERFNTLIRNEISLADIKPNDSLLFIGSGPMPISSILFHRYSGCKVDCYDNNSDAVICSKRFISRLNLDNEIKIYNKDGRDIIPNKYDVVVIALLAKPKVEILEKLSPVISEDTRLVCRTSEGIRQAFYNPAPESIFESYYCKKRISAKGNQTISSLLLYPTSYR